MGSKDKSVKATSKRARVLELCGLPADPQYKVWYEEGWGSYTKVPIDHYRQLRKEGMLPEDEKVLLFREAGAVFYRPPVKEPPTLSISAVQTVVSIAPAIETDSNNGTHAVVSKAAIRTLKLHARATRELLKEFATPSAPKPPVSLSPVETKSSLDGFKTLKKSASQPPAPKTDELSCRKCGDSSFRSRNALFDHIYSNTCEKSSKMQSSIITANNTPVDQTAPASQTAPHAWRSRRLASSTSTTTKAPAPWTPRASGTHSLFTPDKTRPLTASPDHKPLPSPLEWEVEYKPHSCRTCDKNFASRNLLFAHLHDYNHSRPDELSKKTSPSSPEKSLKIKNTSWHSGKVIQMDFGVLGDIMSKLAAVASTG